MKLRVLTLNCQKNYNKNLSFFLKEILSKDKYDVFLLQEATNEVLEYFNCFPKYSIINSTDKLGRISLSCIIYNKDKCSFKDFFYEPILVNKFEKQELKESFQFFGVARAILIFESVKIIVGSIHLPSGFSSKKRFKYLKKVKEIMSNIVGGWITFYAGDYNFSLPYEFKRASKFISPEFKCITSDLGTTLDSYYTESHLPFIWIYINNFLKKFDLE